MGNEVYKSTFTGTNNGNFFADDGTKFSIDSSSTTVKFFKTIGLFSSSSLGNLVLEDVDTVNLGVSSEDSNSDKCIKPSGDFTTSNGQSISMKKGTIDFYQTSSGKLHSHFIKIDNLVSDKYALVKITQPNGLNYNTLAKTIKGVNRDGIVVPLNELVLDVDQFDDELPITFELSHAYKASILNNGKGKIKFISSNRSLIEDTYCYAGTSKQFTCNFKINGEKISRDSNVTLRPVSEFCYDPYVPDTEVMKVKIINSSDNYGLRIVGEQGQTIGTSFDSHNTYAIAVEEDKFTLDISCDRNTNCNNVYAKIDQKNGTFVVDKYTTIVQDVLKGGGRFSDPPTISTKNERTDDSYKRLISFRLTVYEKTNNTPKVRAQKTIYLQVTDNDARFKCAPLNRPNLGSIIDFRDRKDHAVKIVKVGTDDLMLPHHSKTIVDSTKHALSSHEYLLENNTKDTKIIVNHHICFDDQNKYSVIDPDIIKQSTITYSAQIVTEGFIDQDIPSTIYEFSPSTKTLTYKHDGRVAKVLSPVIENFNDIPYSRNAQIRITANYTLNNTDDFKDYDKTIGHSNVTLYNVEFFSIDYVSDGIEVIDGLVRSGEFKITPHALDYKYGYGLEEQFSTLENDSNNLYVIRMKHPGTDDYYGELITFYQPLGTEIDNIKFNVLAPAQIVKGQTHLQAIILGAASIYEGFVEISFNKPSESQQILNDAKNKPKKQTENSGCVFNPKPVLVPQTEESSITKSPVILPTGQFLHNETDIFLQGRERTLKVERNYGHHNNSVSPLGMRWAMSNHIRLFYFVNASGGKYLSIFWDNNVVTELHRTQVSTNGKYLYESDKKQFSAYFNPSDKDITIRTLGVD
ncbi:DUF6531 domain-containing protein, partial [bacterium]|nr:DUF6531 domain-containing protein [bacterium]